MFPMGTMFITPENYPYNDMVSKNQIEYAIQRRPFLRNGQIEWLTQQNTIFYQEQGWILIPMPCVIGRWD